MKPLVGIAPGHIVRDTWSLGFSVGGRAYSDAVIAAGGVPIILPLTGDEPTLRAIYERLDALVFPGGGDVDPALYGEAPEYRGDKYDKIMATDHLRDGVDLALIRWALANRLPTLGICRGLQLVNVASGGTLYQDLSHQTPTDIDHLASSKAEDWSHLAHGLRLKAGSKLATGLRTTRVPVNSLHHQAVHRVGTGLSAVGWSDDGIIEALENDHFIGLQCHPETLWQADPKWLAPFTWLTAAAQTGAPAKMSVMPKTGTSSSRRAS